MTAHLALAKTGRAAFTAAFVLALGATAPALAQAGNPCKSDDPLAEYDESIRRTDCNGDIDYHDWENPKPEKNSTTSGDGQSNGGVQGQDLSYLPTSFSAWFDALPANERRQFALGLAQQAEIGGADMSEEEIDALMVLLRGEIDSYFDSQGLSADQRRRAIAEIAKEVGVSVEPKQASPGDDYDDFGADFGDDYDFGDEYGDEGYDGWAPIDPTDPNAGFGRPDDGEPNSELDLEGW